MGNCLDVPEPKDRRHDRSRNYRVRANPVAVAAPPEVMPVAHGQYYPYNPYVYQFMPLENRADPVLMVDPMTGQEFLVEQSYQGHPHYAHFAEPAVYYSNVPNGVKPKPSRRFHDLQEEDETEKGGAKALKKKSREERKSSQGHDNDKLDIRDASSFTTTPIVATVEAETTRTYYHAEHVPASPSEATMSKTVGFASQTYIPTPPQTPQSSRAEDQANENRHYEIVDFPSNIDDRDFSMSQPLSVSPDMQQDLIISQNELETKPADDQEDDLPETVTSQGVLPPILFFKPGTCYDVVITYSILGRLESDIVRRLSSLLESSGISVWAERLGDSFRARKSTKTAKAILGSKVVVVILSEGSCDQRFIRDHVALATVINAPVHPVTTQPPGDVIEAMPVELRLQLKYDPEDWTEIGTNTEESLLFNLRSLARSVQEEVEYLHEKQNERQDKPSVRSFKRQRSVPHNMKATNFWDVRFGHRHSVKWERMQKTLEEEFKDQLKCLANGQSQPLVLGGLKKKACDDQHPDTVTKERFTALCTQDGEDIDVWEAILRVARIEQAVRDIFDTESTVRHLVLEQTESLGHRTIIEMLCQLLADSDANIRVMSIVSLSTCIHADDTKALELVLSTLHDDDRLVREAGCIALGNLKVHWAVSKLIHVWRNDVISHVREAAFLALSQIGGEEVEESIRLTAVLSDEIRDLTLDTVESP